MDHRHTLFLPAVLWLAACTHTPAPPPVPVENKLDASLRELLQLYETAGACAAERRLAALAPRGIAHDRLAVAVDITAIDADATALLQTGLSVAGGRLDTRFENHLYGWLPLPALRGYAQQDSVWSLATAVPTFAPLATPAKPIPDAAASAGARHVRRRPVR